MRQLLILLLVLIGILFLGGIYFLKQLESEVRRDKRDKKLELLNLEVTFYAGYKAGCHNFDADSTWNIYKTKFTK